MQTFQLNNFPARLLSAICLFFFSSWFKCKHFSYITFRLSCFFSLFLFKCKTFQLYNFPARLLSAIQLLLLVRRQLYNWCYLAFSCGGLSVNCLPGDYRRHLFRHDGIATTTAPTTATTTTTTTTTTPSISYPFSLFLLFYFISLCKKFCILG